MDETCSRWRLRTIFGPNCSVTLQVPGAAAEIEENEGGI